MINTVRLIVSAPLAGIVLSACAASGPAEVGSASPAVKGGAPVQAQAIPTESAGATSSASPSGSPSGSPSSTSASPSSVPTATSPIVTPSPGAPSMSPTPRPSVTAVNVQPTAILVVPSLPLRFTSSGSPIPSPSGRPPRSASPPVSPLLRASLDALLGARSQAQGTIADKCGTRTVALSLINEAIAALDPTGVVAASTPSGSQGTLKAALAQLEQAKARLETAAVEAGRSKALSLVNQAIERIRSGIMRCQPPSQPVR